MKRLSLPVCVVVMCLFCAAGLPAQQPDSTSSNALTLAGSASSAKVPRLVRFSGVLRDLAGQPLTGIVDVEFAIYKDEADEAPLWKETQTLQLDAQGRYTALLGATQPEGLPLLLFKSNNARWLGVSVGKFPEQPRALLVAVPYALKASDADTLAGKPASPMPWRERRRRRSLWVASRLPRLPTSSRRAATTEMPWAPTAHHRGR